MKNRVLLLTLLSIILALPLLAEEWITIYNDDLSLIRSKFELNLPQGRSKYNFDDISSRIDPTSVIVTGNGIRVAEQNYEYDLAGKHQIMAKYLDQEVIAVMKDQSKLRGILKFFDGSNLGIIESGTERLLVISDTEVQWIQYAALPANFYTKPTLAWELISAKKGKYPMQMSYLSGGFSWDVTYNAVWNEQKLLLNSWVTINNRSGKSFEKANLKLIAGEVNRIRDDYFAKAGYGRNVMMESTMDSAAPSFEEKAFHDFHMYSLDQKVSFANNQTKQMELYPTQSVIANPIYEYPTFASGVNSIIRFVNTANQGLGKPLPKGSIKVYKADTDGNLEFIGEDRINHTSLNEELNVTTGRAFDLVASTQVRNQKTVSTRVSEREIHLTLKNNSAEAKRINVVHELSGNAKIVETELRYNFDPSKNKVTYQVDIPANQEKSFFFRERTEW